MCKCLHGAGGDEWPGTHTYTHQRTVDTQENDGLQQQLAAIGGEGEKRVHSGVRLEAYLRGTGIAATLQCAQTTTKEKPKKRERSDPSVAATRGGPGESGCHVVFVFWLRGDACSAEPVFEGDRQKSLWDFACLLACVRLVYVRAWRVSGC